MVINVGCCIFTTACFLLRICHSSCFHLSMNAKILCALLIIIYEIESSEMNTSVNIIKPFFGNYQLEESETLNDGIDADKLVCYYVFTKVFNPQIMDGLCTHINVGFFEINKISNELEISSEQEKILRQVSLLKKKNEKLKIIISVGGAGVMSFSTMVSNHTTRKMFIKSCVIIIKKFNIDGLDLDWEWPVVESGNAKEKIKFVQLLHEIRVEFDRHKKKYILSVDVPSTQSVIELGYYVNYIADIVDYVNVMCYDYHYFMKLYPFTGHNAPLYSTQNDLLSRNVNSSIYFWISNAMPREKIVLGVPTYGHTFQLTFSDQHSLIAPAKGFGTVGNHGFAGYQEICKFLKQEGTTVIYDEISKVPYAYNSLEWVSYDDEKSLAIKAVYVQKEKLGGIMIFSVNNDDFNGTCKGDGIPLPLIRKIRNILFNEV